MCQVVLFFFFRAKKCKGNLNFSSEKDPACDPSLMYDIVGEP